eukprot:g1782.t1
MRAARTLKSPQRRRQVTHLPELDAEKNQEELATVEAFPRVDSQTDTKELEAFPSTREELEIFPGEEEGEIDNEEEENQEVTLTDDIDDFKRRVALKRAKARRDAQKLQEAFHNDFYERALEAVENEVKPLAWYEKGLGLDDDNGDDNESVTSSSASSRTLFRPGTNSSQMSGSRTSTSRSQTTSSVPSRAGTTRMKPRRRSVFIDMNQRKKKVRVGDRVGKKFAQTDGILFAAERRMVITMPSVDAEIAALSVEKQMMQMFKDENARDGNARLALGAEWKLRVNRRKWKKLEDSKGLTGDLEKEMLEKRELEAKGEKKFRYEVCLGRHKKADGTWKREGRDREPVYKIKDMLPDTDSQEVVSTSTRVNNPKFKVMTYNTYSQSNLKKHRDLFMYCPRHLLNWEYRSVNLLKEVLSYGSDIICLQGVDKYKSFWQPKMSAEGYDGLYFGSTKRGADYGLATFYRRSMYQLFRSDFVEFREIEEQAKRGKAKGEQDLRETVTAVVKEAQKKEMKEKEGKGEGEEEGERKYHDPVGEARQEEKKRIEQKEKEGGFMESPLKNDDIALFCTLQPWETSPHPSAVLVVNTELAEKPPHDVKAIDSKEYLRMLQARLLLRRVEAFNSHMQLPVLMCGTFHVEKTDPIYHMLATGSLPTLEKPPGRPGRPVASRPTWSSMWVRWEVPKDEGSNRIVGFKVQRRVGQSTAIGFTNEVFVPMDLVQEAATDSSSGSDEDVKDDSKLGQLMREYEEAEMPRPKAAAFVLVCREKTILAQSAADDAIAELARAKDFAKRATSVEKRVEAMRAVEERDMENKICQSKLKTAKKELDVAERGDPIAMAERMVALNQKIQMVGDDPMKRGILIQAKHELEETKKALSVLEKFMSKETKRVREELAAKKKEEEERLKRGDAALLEAKIAERKRRKEKRLKKEAEKRARRRRKVKVFKPKYCEYNPTGLAAGLVYEFRVAAMSSIGMGEWSRPSAPVATKISKRQTSGLSKILKSKPEEFELNLNRKMSTKEAQEIDINLILGPRTTGLTPRQDDGKRLEEVAMNRMRDLEEYFAKKGVRKGLLDPLHVHCLTLRSAYALYPENPSLFTVAEPQATLITERRTELTDYIFYSAERMVVKRLMSLPEKKWLKDVDAREPEMVTETEKDRPKNWVTQKFILETNYETGDIDEIQNPEYRGPWKPQLIMNKNRHHNYLPNRHISSPHLALCAELAFSDLTICSEWY